MRRLPILPAGSIVTNVYYGNVREIAQGKAVSMKFHGFEIFPRDQSGRK